MNHKELKEYFFLVGIVLILVIVSSYLSNIRISNLEQNVQQLQQQVNK